MTHDPYAARDNGRFSTASKKGPELLKLDISSHAIQRFGDETTTVHFYADKEALGRANIWFDWMKKNNVYNNTLIIVVSDHGREGIKDPMFKKQKSEDCFYYAAYHPLLMVKDFGANGELKTDYKFMTHADVPSIVLSAIDPDAKKKYGRDKSKGFRVYTEKGNLTVYDNIFELKNWVYKKEE